MHICIHAYLHTFAYMHTYRAGIKTQKVIHNCAVSCESLFKLIIAVVSSFYAYL